jgi:hypothetical protein
MNKFGIPAEIESAIRARDVECVYCQKAMVPPTSTPNLANWATIEHLDHLPPFPYREGQTADDFAIACGSCNSSRRDKPLWVFIAKRGIADTIAPVIKAFLGRAKASEVLVQQEFVNLLTSRPVPFSGRTYGEYLQLDHARMNLRLCLPNYRRSAQKPAQ